ncbi:MAG: hypothetical protein HQK66_02830 [Desulfamplus sp.]|nr:hypothetical protein [Desulfamplus sp.]
MVFFILLSIGLVLLSYLVGLLGKNRKFGFWGYFFCSLMFSPLIGLLLVLASDPRPPKDIKIQD